MDNVHGRHGGKILSKHENEYLTEFRKSFKDGLSCIVNTETGKKFTRQDFLGAKYEKRKTKWKKAAEHIFRYAATDEKLEFFSKKRLESPEARFILMGGRMEITADELKAINIEAKESVKILQETWNELTKTQDLLEPELIKMVKNIRDMRMNVTVELHKTLSLMRDVRKFFIEKEYEVEIKRLEEFVKISERMRALIDDGTLDAICEISLKFALWEGGKNDSIKRKGVEKGNGNE